MEFKIDEEIRTLNIELRPEEYNEMKAMAQETGEITPPIIIWKGKNIIVDGHHRYQISQELGLECPYKEVEFENKNAAMIYALRIQGSGRKGDTGSEKAYRIGKQYILMKLPEGRQLGHGQLGQNGQVRSTAEIIAARLGLGEKTVRRHAEFAGAIDIIKSKVENDLWKAILREELAIKKEDISKLAKFLMKDDLFYLPPPTEAELKERQKKLEDEEREHSRSGEPNIPPVMTNLLKMQALASDAEEAVYCPFCGEKGGCHLKLTWISCNHSIDEAVVKANENLEQFSQEAKARVDAREAEEKERNLKKLISVEVMTSVMLEEEHPPIKPEAAQENLLHQKEGMGLLAAQRCGYKCRGWSVLCPPGCQAQGRHEIVVLPGLLSAIRIVAGSAIDFGRHTQHFRQEGWRKWEVIQQCELPVLYPEHQIGDQISFGDGPGLTRLPLVQIFTRGLTEAGNCDADWIQPVCEHFIDNRPPAPGSVHKEINIFPCQHITVHDIFDLFDNCRIELTTPSIQGNTPIMVVIY